MRAATFKPTTGGAGLPSRLEADQVIARQKADTIVRLIGRATQAPATLSSVDIALLHRAVGNRVLGQIVQGHRASPATKPRMTLARKCTECEAEGSTQASHTAGKVVTAVGNTVGDALGGASKWAGAKVRALGAGLLDQRRLAVLAQIAVAQRRLVGQASLPIANGQLATLNGHLAALREKSGGAFNLSDIAAVNANGGPEGAVSTIAGSSIAALLAGLQSSLSRPAVSAATSESDAGSTQRSVYRFFDAAAAAAAATAAAEETATIGVPIASGLAPETGLASYVVLGIVIAIVAIVAAIIVYFATRPSTPDTDPDAVQNVIDDTDTDTDMDRDMARRPDPVMRKGLSRKKKEKWKKCFEMFKQYKKVTGAEWDDLRPKLTDLFERIKSLKSAEKTELCALVIQQMELVDRLFNERKSYIKNRCDEIVWFEDGSTEDERRERHERELDNVRARRKKLGKWFKTLKDGGAC